MQPMRTRLAQPPGPAPDGPAILLLHEGLGSLDLWRDFPEALAAATGRTVWAYERRGHGASEPLEAPWPSDWLEQEASEALPEVLRALHLECPILVGHSDGGTLALQYAAQFPERVSAVVTLAAHVYVDARTLAGVEAAGRAYREGDLRRRLEKYHGANTDGLFQRWHETWLDPARRDWSMAAALRAIRCPVLALQGEDDAYGLPSQVEAIVQGTEGLGHLIPGCGHTTHLEAREATLAAIVDFLRGCFPPA